MSNNFRLNDEVLNSLGSRMKMAYLAWWHGEDLRPILPKNTFYRYRNHFKQYDTDIAMVRDVEKLPEHTIPTIQILEAKPVGIPYWAFEQGLVVAPAHEMPIQASNDETASTDRVPSIAL